MAEIKKVNDITLDENLTLMADAIREKLAITGNLGFPNSFKTEIDKTHLLDNLVMHSVSGAIYMNGDRIRVNAFSYSDITEIHAPNATQFYTDVTGESGYASFMNCTKLSVIDLPKMHYVNNNGYQFAGCISLTEVELPELTTVGQYMFNGCTGLTSFSGPLVTSINQYSFQNDTKLESEHFYTPLVTSLSHYVFNNCKKITSFPSTAIQTIGNYTFANSGITGSLNLDNLTSIGNYAFSGCTGISSISFPEVTSLGEYSFYNCKNISNISLPKATTIGRHSFIGCTGLTTLSLPSTTSIGIYCFQNCRNITTISLPAIKTIGEFGFDGCNQISSLSLPNLTTLSTHVFRGCSAVTSVSAPLLTTIGNNAFNNDTGINTPISFPAATSIGTSCFYGDTNIPSFNLPKITSAATGAFYNCQKCESYNLNSLKTIYQNAFYNNYELTVLILPQVTTISGANSFNNCSKLKTIDMGPSATNLSGTTIFNNCSVLDTIIIRRTDAIAPLSDINSFTGTPFAEGGSGGIIYVPQALISSYEADTNWSVILGYINENEELQNQILPLEGSQYEYYYGNENPLPYTVTFDTPIYVSKATGQTMAFSPTTTATTVYAQDAYSNSFDFAPFSASDFDVTVTMKGQDITSTAYSVTNNIGTISIAHILGPISITIKFHEAMGTQLFTGVSLYTKNTGGSITTPTEGWRTMKSTANASWNIQIIYKGATNLFKQMSALYGHYVRMDLNAEWNTYVSGGLYITPGGFTSITGTPARQAYEQFVLTNGKNFNNSVIFKLPDDKNDWQYVASGGTPANTNYYSSIFYFYSNKNGSITINSANFYDLGTMEPETI